VKAAVVAKAVEVVAATVAVAETGAGVVVVVAEAATKAHQFGKTVIIGNQLRALREQQKLSQGDIEKRTGLLRCYVSRVENGHTVPSIETLEKWARALNVPLYQLFYENNAPVPEPIKDSKGLWGAEGKDAHYLRQLRRSLSRTRDRDRQLLLHMARKLAKPKVA
jgi:transcriptional regulator with XRE-family HTH domain